MENLSFKHFVYFCFNYPHNFVDEAFKGHMHLQHLKSKFDNCYAKVGSRNVILTFFMELDLNNQEILENYIKSIKV